MKIEFESQDLQSIAEKVVELLIPVLKVDDRKDGVFDKKTLAEFLQVDISWVDKNLYTIPYFKVGKYVRFRRSDIDRWIEKNKILPSQYLKMVR